MDIGPGDLDSQRKAVFVYGQLALYSLDPLAAVYSGFRVWKPQTHALAVDEGHRR